MKLPKYPLENLVLIKKKRLDQAEKELNNKKEALKKEQDTLKTLEGERDKVKQHKDQKLKQLRDTLDQGTTSDKIDMMKKYLKEIDEDLRKKNKKVQDQLKRIEEAEKQVEIARQDFIKKRQEVEKMSLHKKEWEKEAKAEILYQESMESDEMGSSMHIRKKKGS